MEKLKSYDLKNEDKEFTNKEVRRARFRLLEFFNQKYNIIIYISGSSARTEVFRKLAEKLILINNRIK